MKILRSLCAGLIALSAPAFAIEVHEFQLENGLKVLVKPDQRAPVAVSQIWYHIGAADEPDGTSGIAHLLEHLMFKGTATVGPGEFSRQVAALGGQENAFTSSDFTAYHETFASDQLAAMWALEADRMQHLRFTPEGFAKELEVVKEERRLRTDDDPQQLLSEHFDAVAWLTSPYRRPVIGWMEDIQRLTLADAAAWYQRYYAPNNATLVVVGDVVPAQVQALAVQYFGNIPRREVAPRPVSFEITQRGMREVRVRAPATWPTVMLGYKVPVLMDAQASWEPYALAVLAGILDGGDSARFARELVRGGAQAAQASASYDLYPRLHGLFQLEATPAPRVSVAQLRAALLAQVQALQTAQVSAAELSRVRAQVVAQAVYQQDSPFYQAFRIGMLESNGLGWRRLNELVPNIQAVTAAQVQTVAQRYLTEDRLTVGILEPQPLAPGATGTSTTEQQHAH